MKTQFFIHFKAGPLGKALIKPISCCLQLSINFVFCFEKQMQTKRRNMYLLKNLVINNILSKIMLSGSFDNHITQKLFKNVFFSGVRKKMLQGGGLRTLRLPVCSFLPFILCDVVLRGSFSSTSSSLMSTEPSSSLMSTEPSSSTTNTAVNSAILMQKQIKMVYSCQKRQVRNILFDISRYCTQL